MNSIPMMKILQKGIVLVYILLQLNIESFGQLIQNQSIEFDMPAAYTRPDYTVIPLKNGGFILQERNNETYGRKEIIWTTKKFSNGMKLVWEKEIKATHGGNK